MWNKDPIIKRGYAVFFKGWLSNWCPSPFVVDGINYLCVEQFMMAEKARLFNDQITLAKILETSSPKDMQKFGRQVANYNESVWAEKRYAVVLKGTLEKYRQNPGLRQKLFELPANVIFVEANPVDYIWGIGMTESNPDIFAAENWRGLNLLGKVIQEARAILEKEFSNVVKN